MTPRSVRLDPHFPAAHAFLAYSHFTGSRQALEEPREAIELSARVPFEGLPLAS